MIIIYLIYLDEYILIYEKKQMRKKQLYCFILILFSNLLLADNSTNFNCLTINYDVENMKASMASGDYRKSKTLAGNNELVFEYDHQTPFIEYLDYATKLIALKKPLADLPCPINTATTAILKKQKSYPEKLKAKHLVAPFELTQTNNEKAILLIHGLTDSPYWLHDLAYDFYQQGYNVRTLLLPGHGTAPSDLLSVDYQEWQLAADYAINRTLADYKNVYLGGFSTGGALIFNHLFKQDKMNDKLKGLLMWSPASKAKSDIAWLAQYVNYLPFINWLDKDADTDFAKYESFSFNAAAQVNSLMNIMMDFTQDKKTHVHNIPLLVVASEHDQTIDTQATLALIAQWQKGKLGKNKSPDTLIYYGNKANAVQALPANIEVITPECKNELCQSISSIAHGAITNSPNNPYYGYDGYYRNCSHYLSDLAKYEQCKLSDEVVLSEIIELADQEEKLIQRLTFNPYYQQMMLTVSEFLIKTQ